MACTRVRTHSPRSPLTLTQLPVAPIVALKAVALAHGPASRRSVLGPAGLAMRLPTSDARCELAVRARTNSIPSRRRRFGPRQVTGGRPNLRGYLLLLLDYSLLRHSFEIRGSDTDPLQIHEPAPPPGRCSHHPGLPMLASTSRSERGSPSIAFRPTRRDRPPAHTSLSGPHAAMKAVVVVQKRQHSRSGST